MLNVSGTRLFVDRLYVFPENLVDSLNKMIERYL